MIPYHSPDRGNFPFCEGCPARDYCLGLKEPDPDDKEFSAWLSEVCHEQRGEWSLTYGRLNEDEPDFSPEPWEEYIPEPEEPPKMWEGDPDV